VTPQDVLNQAHHTADLLGISEEEDDFLDLLWEFAFATYSIGLEDGDITFPIIDLYIAFESPRGCPT
jgi:hypothetical protein